MNNSSRLPDFNIRLQNAMVDLGNLIPIYYDMRKSRSVIPIKEINAILQLHYIDEEKGVEAFLLNCERMQWNTRIGNPWYKLFEKSVILTYKEI